MPVDSRAVWTPSSSATNVTGLDRRIRNWTNTVGYSGQGDDNLPINSYTDSQCKGQCNIAKSTRTSKLTGVVVTTDKGWGPTLTNFESLMFPAGGKSHRSDASFQNELTLRCLTKVSDAKTNLGVMFAERTKTANLIYDTANRIYRAMREFRRGRIRRAAEILNINPGRTYKSFLEMKYGWMPLLMDVKNSAEFFAQLHVGRPLRFSVMSRLSEDLFWKITQAGFNRMGFDSNLESIAYNYASRKTCRVKIWCEISNPHLSQLQQLGVTNPALVAWELVPYSFVFDWFIGVGQWLQGLTALHGVTVRKAMFSSSTACASAAIETFPGYNGTFDIYGAWTINRFASNRRYSRSPIAISPTSLYPPVDTSPISMERLFTGLALLRSNARNFGLLRV